METGSDTGDADGWSDLGGGMRRRILTHSPDMMVCEVAFPAGGVGPLHRHVHLQAVFVQAGRFEFTVGGETRLVSAGDALVIPSDALHGCRAIEAGTLIDTFQPARQDFLVP